MAFRLPLLLVLEAIFLTISLAQNSFCPAPNGDFPNPSSDRCTTFFRCLRGNPSLIRCPINQRFDFLFSICRPQGVVNCNSQLQVYAAPAISPPIGGRAGRFSPLVGNGGLGGLSGLGAGLPGGGIFSLLSSLDGNNDGQDGGNGLATLLMMSALMNQQNSKGQQNTNADTVPLSSIYPLNNQMPLASFVDDPNQVTNQNSQQPRDVFSRDLSGVSSGSSLPGSGGKTFIFVPQYSPIQGQTSQRQDQGNVASPWAGNDATDQIQNGGVGQVPNQVLNTVQGQISQQSKDNQQVQGPDLQQGLGTLQGHDIQQGQDTQVQSPPQGQGGHRLRNAIRKHNAMQGLGIVRGRGQGQRQNFSTQLQNMLIQPSPNVDLDADTTAGSLQLSDLGTF